MSDRLRELEAAALTVAGMLEHGCKYPDPFGNLLIAGSIARDMAATLRAALNAEPEPSPELLAAAPEMYELLRDLRDNILEIENPAHYQNSPHQRVCALIEKIDGLAPSQAIGALLARIDGESDD